MIGPDLRSSAFQVLSALAVPENRSGRETWPQLLRLSTTSGHRPLQPQASTTRTCTQTSGRSHGPRCNAAFQQSNKESSNISFHRRRRPRPHPLPFSLKTATGPGTIVSRRPHGHRPCTPADQEPVCRCCCRFLSLLASMIK